jgi:hypothetical protein
VLSISLFRKKVEAGVGMESGESFRSFSSPCIRAEFGAILC